MTPDEVGKRVLDLHQRHADAVGRVLENAVGAYRTALVNHALPATSILVMSVSPGTVTYAPDEGRQEGPFEEWIARTEAAEEGPEKKTAAHEPLQIAIHAVTGLVVVRDLVRLDAADSKLIRELRVFYDEDLSAGRILENHQYITSENLAALLEYGEVASLRRRVMSCRKAVAEAYERKHGQALPPDALVQNKPGAGYRLDPHIRFVAFTEIDR